MSEFALQSKPAPATASDIRAYMLDLIAELGDLAEAYDHDVLAADLKRILAAHAALGRAPRQV